MWFAFFFFVVPSLASTSGPTLREMVKQIGALGCNGTVPVCGPGTVWAPKGGGNVSQCSAAFVNRSLKCPTKYQLSVPENSAPGTHVGIVQATDPKGKALEYSLLTRDRLKAFKVNPKTGEITTTGEFEFDHEAMNSFQFHVRAIDPTDVTVFVVCSHRVFVTNVPELPPVAFFPWYPAEQPVSNVLGKIVDMMLGDVSAIQTRKTQYELTSVSSLNDGKNLVRLSNSDENPFEIDNVTSAVKAKTGFHPSYQNGQTWVLTVKIQDGQGLAESITSIVVVATERPTSDLRPKPGVVPASTGQNDTTP